MTYTTLGASGSASVPTSQAPRRRGNPPIALLAASAAVLYFITIGGSSAGEVYTLLRGANAVLGGVLITYWLWRLAHDHDEIDLAALTGLLLFLISCLASTQLRMSFDSAVGATAWVAVFWYARRALATEDARRWLIWLLGMLFIALVAFYFILWTGYWLQWAELLGGMPALSLPLPTGLYLHRHDVALLLVMLAPAMLVPIGIGRLRPVVWIGAAMLIVVLLIDGSRSLAAAICLALVIVYLPRLAAIEAWRSRRTYLLVAGMAVVGLTVAILSGLAGAVAGRLFDLNTLSTRGILWGAAIELFRERPLTGVGPGGFLFSLSGTGYYDTSTFLPRNTDGAVPMILAETGVIGLLALAIPGASVLRRLVAVARTRPWMAFAPVVFILAGLGSVPSDFAYLVLPFFVWSAYAIPRRTRSEVKVRVGTVKWILAAPIAMAVALTVIAAGAYETGLRNARQGEFDVARANLDMARMLDPGFALYDRVASAIALSMADLDAAVELSADAIADEPSDVAAHRVSALAHLANGEPSHAATAAEAAVSIMRSDPLNHQLALLIAESSADPDRDDLAVAVLERAPWYVVAPEWQRLHLDSRLLLAHALERVGSSGERLGSMQLQWLRVLTGSNQFADTAAEHASTVPAASKALERLFECDIDAAQHALAVATPAEQALVMHWATAAMVSSAAGQATEIELALAELAGHRARADTGVDIYLSFRTDLWGYRRLPPARLSQPVDLTSTQATLHAWMVDSESSASTAAPWTGLAACEARAIADDSR